MPDALTNHVARNEELWDAFVQQNGGNFLQSWGWSRFQEAVGRTVYRFRIDRSAGQAAGTGSAPDDTVVQFMLVEHALPFGFRYAYVPRGPIISTGDQPIERFETFLAALRDGLQRQGYVFARLDLPWTLADTPVTPAELEAFGFRDVKEVQPANTTIVDLAPTEDELLKRMHSKTRYNIRLADRHGVTVKEARRDNAHLFRHELELFWRLLSATSSRDNFHTHPRSYYETMLDALSPKKQLGVVTRLWFAEHNGEAVAAAITCEYGDTVTYLHGASDHRFRKLMAPHALHWALIQQAKADGFKHYDFWGIAPNDEPNHPWAGITRFKTGFGGRKVNYLGSFELPASPLWYQLYRYAKRFRNV
jgi:lipid II:glycine glycyltransferase (peptidoglycan interpeptide bridge formation enzyme)